MVEPEAATPHGAAQLGRAEKAIPSLFQSALRDRWQLLPPEVRALHAGRPLDRFSGFAQVSRGTRWLARMAAWSFGFPAAAEQVPLTVTKIRTASGETWERNFGGQKFRSVLAPSPVRYCVRERFGLFQFEQDLPVHGGCLYLPVRRGWFMGLPLPRWLLPRSESREYVERGLFHFDVALYAPLGGGLIVRYQGQLKPDRESGVDGADHCNRWDSGSTVPGEANCGEGK